jgi:hypothetical protein
VTWKATLVGRKGEVKTVYITGVPETLPEDVVEDIARAMVPELIHKQTYLAWRADATLAPEDGSALEQGVPAFSFLQLLAGPVEQQKSWQRPVLVERRLAFAMVRAARASNVPVREWVRRAILTELERQGYSPADLVQCLLQGEAV